MSKNLGFFHISRCNGGIKIAHTGISFEFYKHFDVKFGIVHHPFYALFKIDQNYIISHKNLHLRRASGEFNRSFRNAETKTFIYAAKAADLIEVSATRKQKPSFTPPLPLAIDNPAPAQIVRRKGYSYPVAGNNSNVMFPHFT
jgi:hypothetical protein